MRMAAIFAALGLATSAAAGPFDGIYRPAGDWAAGWDCRTVGSDGGALAIRDGRFFGVENVCALTNPVQVRDMNAVLFDGECTGEGMTYSERLMLMAIPGGVAVIRDGSVSELRRCDRE